MKNGGMKLTWRKSLSSLLPLGVILAATLVYIAEPAPLTLLRLKVFDTYQRLQPREYSEQPVTIIDIDEESLRRLGQWPWPRDHMAKLTTSLFEQGAAAVAYDIIFAEPDRTSPARMAQQWKNEIPALTQAASNLPDYDQRFAETMAATNVTNGVTLSNANDQKPARPFGLVVKGTPPATLTTNYNGAIESLPLFTEAANGNGAINALPDMDGIIRKVPLMLRVQDDWFPGLAMETLRIAQGASTYILSGSEAGNEQLRVGAFDVPANAEGQMWLHFTEYTDKRYVPAWKVLEGALPEERLLGHLVLIGTSAAGLKDIRSTPLNPVTSGVELHAQALEQVLSEHYLHRPAWMRLAELGALIAAGLFVWALVALTSPYIGAIGTVLLLAAGGYGSWIAFRDFHLLIDPVTPGLTVGMLYISESLRGYISSERERKYVRSAFGRYMSPALVEKLASQPDSLRLGGETKEMTILFCDIRGFTTISEQFDAEGLTQFINRFLTPMTDIILARHGTIDKYMGDCIMAFWNAPLDDPDHAEHAARAALAMVASLESLNAEREQECREQGTRFIPVRIGIGLNSDQCCVGNMGSDQRFDYSVLGDGVNLASRLEGQSKAYGMTIVIGEHTYAATPEMASIELDLIKAKGKTEAVRIYGLLGDETLAASDHWPRLLAANEAMLSAYRHQDWEEAKAQADQLEQQATALNLDLSGFVALYRERIAIFEDTPPPPDWNGVFEATSK